MDFITYRKNFKDKLAIVCKLHDFLDEIVEENYQELIFFLQESKFLETKESMSQLLRSINSFSLCRPINITIYIRLLTDLIEIIKKFFISSEICSFFEHNRILLFFYEKELITVKMIISKVYFIHDIRFIYFDQELRKDESLRYEKIYKDYENENIIYDDIFIKNRNYCFCTHELCALIRNDDVHTFQSILSQSDEKNVLRSPIPLSSKIFEVNNYLLAKSSLTFLNYAAYYGSVQIFKYIFSKLDTLGSIYDIEYAIAGGNSEIIHIYEEYFNEQKEENENDEDEEAANKFRIRYLRTMLKASLYFHRNEITEYLISNYSHKIKFEFNLERDFDLRKDEDENSLNEKIENEKCFLFYSFLNYHYSLKNYNIRFLMDHIDDESIFDRFYSKYVNFEDNQHIELKKLSVSEEDFDLLKTQKNSFDHNRTPFFHACYYGHPDIADLLMNKLHVNGNISEISEDYRSPFQISVIRQKNEIVTFLLKNDDPNFDMNPKDNDGITPFLESCRIGNFDIFIELFNNGQQSKSSNKINVLDASNSLSTPLHYAAVSHNLDILEFLIDTNLYNVDAQDDEGWTPLMNGCDYDIVQLVKLLIEKGHANPNLVENYGSTAFMKYASIDCIDCVKYLIDLPNIKESLNFQDSDGDTAIHRLRNCATGKDNQATLFLIQEKSNFFNLNIQNLKGISFF